MLLNVLPMSSLWVCGLSPAEHRSKYLASLLGWDIDTPEHTARVTSLEKHFLLWKVTTHHRDSKISGVRSSRACADHLHRHNLFLKVTFAQIEVFFQVLPFFWLFSSCPQFCLAFGYASFTSTGIFQFQVAACELLHSIVAYMLGKASQMPERQRGPPPMYQLYKRIFPVLLRLACDVDQVKIITLKHFSLFHIPLCIEINL